MSWRPEEEVTAAGGAASLATAERGAVRRRFLRDPAAMAGFVVVVLMVLVAVFAPLIAPYDPTELDVGPVREGPTLDHPMGTDTLGRDELSRVIYGTRTSLAVGLGSVALAVALGVLLGAIAGWYGGWLDSLVMRTTDVLLAVPYFVLGIAFLTAVGPSLPAMIVLLGVTGWLAIARVVRIGFHRARELEYVEAARALGFTDRRVMFRHVLPNTIPPVIVYAAIGVGGAVLAEAAFSFIGVGVPGEHPSWGVMVNAARGMLSTSPHLVFFPSLAIFVLVLAFVLVGDGLRDALEPDEAAR